MFAKVINASWVIRWIPAVLLMIIIFAFSSVPSEEMPHFGWVDFFIKKLGHLTGYAMLSLAFALGLGIQKERVTWIAWLLAVAYAITDEFHQSFVPGRNASPVDVGIDALGAFIGLIPIVVYRKFRSAKELSVQRQDYSPNSNSNSDFQSHS
jgi:hypothetical protein